MNRAFQPGEFVIVTPWDEVGRDPKPGDIVVVERVQHGLYEYSLKRVRLNGRGIEFWPESTDPKHRSPLDTTVRDGEQIGVWGLVVGRFAPV